MRARALHWFWLAGLHVACVSGGKPGSPCEKTEDCQRGMVCDRRFPGDKTKVCLVDLGGPSFRLAPQASPAKPVATDSAGTPSGTPCGGTPPPAVSPAGVDCRFGQPALAAIDAADLANPVVTERALIYRRWLGGSRDRPLEQVRFQPLSTGGELAGAPVTLALDWVGRSALQPSATGYLVAGGRGKEALLVELDARGQERRRIVLGDATGSLGDAALVIEGDRAFVTWSIALREVWAAWVLLKDWTRASAFRIAQNSHSPRALVAADGVHVAWATRVDRVTRYSTARVSATELLERRSRPASEREPSVPVGLLRVGDGACPVVRVGAVNLRMYLDCASPKLIGQVAILGFSGAVTQTASAGALAYTREGIRLQWLDRGGDPIGAPMPLGESRRDTAPSLFGTPGRLWAAWQRRDDAHVPHSIVVRSATCGGAGEHQDSSIP